MDVKRFSKKIVWDRAIEVAEAGLRHTMNKPPHLVSILGTDEPLPDTAKQLLMDFMGSNYARLPVVYPKENEQKIAESDFPVLMSCGAVRFAGMSLPARLPLYSQKELSTLGVSAFHQDFAEKVSYRPEHLSVAVSTSGGPLPFNLSLVNSDGKRLGGSELDQ